LSFFLSALVSFAAARALADDDHDSEFSEHATIAKVAEGDLRGVFVEADGLVAFLGVPYAAPPVGDLRWKRPIPPAKRSGVYHTSFSRPNCVQGSAAAVAGAEDCLYLNVLSDPEPGARSRLRRLPVPLRRSPGCRQHRALRAGDLATLRRGLNESMMAYLANFARSANPNGPGLPRWKRYDPADKLVLSFGYPIDPSFDAFSEHKCQYWYAAPPSDRLLF